MKVEVGDWVRLRGMRRIYEVQSVGTPRATTSGGTHTVIKVEGLSSNQIAEHVEARRPGRHDADLLARAQARLVVCRDAANPFDDAMLDCAVIRDLLAALKGQP